MSKDYSLGFFKKGRYITKNFSNPEKLVTYIRRHIGFITDCCCHSYCHSFFDRVNIAVDGIFKCTVYAPAGFAYKIKAAIRYDVISNLLLDVFVKGFVDNLVDEFEKHGLVK